MNAIDKTNALAVLPGAVSTILASDTTDILGKLREELEGFTADVSTERGRKEIASKAYKVSVAKADLVRLAKALKEGAQKTIKLVNAETNVIEERMDALRDEIRAPLDEFEAIEERRIAGHTSALQEIACTTVFALPEPTAAEIELRLSVLKDAMDRDWQEFSAKAVHAHSEALTRLTAIYDAAVVREAERAEIARLRAEAEERARLDRIREQAERERQIAEQAAEQARIAAEQRAAEERRQEAERVANETRRIEAQAAAERERAEREQQAAQRRAEAAEQAAREAELQRLAAIEQAQAEALEAERRAEARRVADQQQADRDRQAAVKAEQDRVAAEQAAEAQALARRAADNAHRAKINGAAVAGLEATGMTTEQARTVVTAIAKGQIPHVSIGY
jgi:colicin import membrane protein